jgi:hypothetical protein
MVDGLTSPVSRGVKVTTCEVDEPLFVFVFLFALFIIGFGTGETHIAFIDTIFAEILLT